MERFKVLEKETKTKAYSTQALNQAAAGGRSAKDPTDDPKYATKKWIAKARAKIKAQMTALEKTLEGHKASGKSKSGKGTKASDGDFKDLQKRIDRHQLHLEKLKETKQRLKEDTLTIEQVEEIREDVNHYIDNNSVSPLCCLSAACLRVCVSTC